MTGLLDKVVVVTGAARGTGRVHCERFADEGADVIALDAPAVAGDLRDTAGGVENRGRRCALGLADVSDLEAVTAGVDAGVAELGRLDVVVANAGIHMPGAPSWELDPRDWQRTLDVNLTGSFLSVKPALAGMTKGKSGRIVFIASTAGLKGYGYVAPYVAAKHGVVGLMRALATEMARTGVTVNAVCPGFVESDMLEDSVQRIVEKTGRTVEQARASLSATNPQGRFIQPQEVAAAVLWLCSDAAGSITGQALSLSGGETW